MTIFELNLENINELPLIDWNTKDDGLYTSVVIVPTGEIHDSGYQCMQFVFCRGTEALKRVDRVRTYYIWMVLVVMEKCLNIWDVVYVLETGLLIAPLMDI